MFTFTMGSLAAMGGTGASVPGMAFPWSLVALEWLGWVLVPPDYVTDGMAG